MARLRFGPYVVVRKLGEGGMGTVFEVVHETIEKRGAIKILRQDSVRTPEIANRFINEARAVNRVEHPGLVQVNDFVRMADGSAYIVMEYLNGETLATRLQHSGGTIPIADMIHIGWQLADSLAAAHAKGVIHRDLKPSNVMLVFDPHMPTGERSKILDFGLAKFTDKVDGLFKTRSSVVMGTPIYMSPEQCEGANRVDTRSDVYSLGCMFYEMLCGRPPFIGEGSGQVMGMHMYQEPPKLVDIAPSVPGALAVLVHTMLRKDKGQRPSMREVTSELTCLIPLAPNPTRRAQTPQDGTTPSEIRRLATDSTMGDIAERPVPNPLLRKKWFQYGFVIVAVLGVALTAGLRFSKQRSEGRWPSQLRSAPPPRLITVKVESVPDGATVESFREGRILGKTPWSREQAPDEAGLQLRLTFQGYHDRTIVLDTARDVVRREVLEKVAESLGAVLRQAALPSPDAPAVPTAPLAQQPQSARDNSVATGRSPSGLGTPPQSTSATVPTTRKGLPPKRFVKRSRIEIEE
jgi:serine/threonine protein kinase